MSAPVTDSVIGAVQDASPLYLYAITLAYRAAPEHLTGPAGPDGVFRVGAAGLSAVVARAPVPLLAAVDPDDVSETGVLAGLARSHDRVVRAVAEQGAVLPVRFGTVLTGPDAARRLLQDRRDAVLPVLHLVSGCREWGLKLRALPSDPPAPGRPANGAAYLTQRRDALGAGRRRAEARQRGADDVHAALTQVSRTAVTRGGSGASDVVLDAAYLVPEATEEEFLLLVAALASAGGPAEAAGLGLELTGPWPPYSFAGPS